VVLVDDHGLFRAGVAHELAGSVDLVGEAGDVEKAIVVIRATRPDVVLLDVHLPGGGGRAILDACVPELPGTRFLALSVSDAADDVIGVVRGGARGYVTKGVTADELLDAIHRVAAGEAVADVVNPATGSTATLRASRDGVLFASTAHRHLLRGMHICKIAGTTPFRSGSLLSQ
jgi:DNA-binding NarL/FixJ family response regulator